MGQFWEELTIADNFIFCKVMENERICRGVLETLLGIKVEHIDYLRIKLGQSIRFFIVKLL